MKVHTVCPYPLTDIMHFFACLECWDQLQTKDIEEVNNMNMICLYVGQCMRPVSPVLEETRTTLLLSAYLDQIQQCLLTESVSESWVNIIRSVILLYS